MLRCLPSPLPTQPTQLTAPHKPMVATLPLLSTALLPASPTPRALLAPMLAPPAQLRQCTAHQRGQLATAHQWHARPRPRASTTSLTHTSKRPANTRPPLRTLTNPTHPSSHYLFGRWHTAERRPKHLHGHPRLLRVCAVLCCMESDHHKSGLIIFIKNTLIENKI
jgi:hypothetical protein